MLDIAFIRENTKLIKRAAELKGVDLDLDRLIALDAERRNLLKKIEDLRYQRNKLTAGISRKANQEKQKDIAKVKTIKKRLKKFKDTYKKIEEQYNQLMLRVPNVPAKEVPPGKGEKDNKVIKIWGKKPVFKFKPREHTEIAEGLDIIDFQRGAKVSGHGFYFLKNEGALLEIAVLNLAIAEVVKAGFHFLVVPQLVREFAMMGTGFFPTDEREVYKTALDNLYLIGTAEVPLGAYRSGEILKEEDLPLRYAGISSCFRREAGAHGVDTKGVYRIHQFNKVEMFVLCKPERSEEEHQKLVQISENILQKLRLPYRVTLNCTGDLGMPQVKKYDIQTWMPGRGKYGETHSASNDADFQARRLKIRYKDKQGKIHFVHTLNNTAIASPRILIAILENYQQKDGSVQIPSALQPFIGKSVIK